MPGRSGNVASICSPWSMCCWRQPCGREGPFPQLRLVLLSECGSHAFIAAAIGDRLQAERRMAEQVLPSLTSEMFVLHDAQFTGLHFWQEIRARRAQVMGPLPSHHLPTY